MRRQGARRALATRSTAARGRVDLAASGARARRPDRAAPIGRASGASAASRSPRARIAPGSGRAARLMPDDVRFCRSGAPAWGPLRERGEVPARAVRQELGRRRWRRRRGACCSRGSTRAADRRLLARCGQCDLDRPRRARCAAPRRSARRSELLPPLCRRAACRRPSPSAANRSSPPLLLDEAGVRATPELLHPDDADDDRRRRRRRRRSTWSTKRASGPTPRSPARHARCRRLCRPELLEHPPAALEADAACRRGARQPEATRLRGSCRGTAPVTLADGSEVRDAGAWRRARGGVHRLRRPRVARALRRAPPRSRRTRPKPAHGAPLKGVVHLTSGGGDRRSTRPRRRRGGRRHAAAAANRRAPADPQRLAAARGRRVLHGERTRCTKADSSGRRASAAIAMPRRLEIARVGRARRHATQAA